MSSIIEGYNYDIFISYRQKDNKYDGWVTEFVDNLKKELEATFKEEISVYYDINTQDGLLETHDVDASLKEKLKCLIFMPIMSRTYCDPKSFAWENEFKAFVDMASKDQFGLKVKLPDGNVASRVLPIRIHDLNTADVKLYESILEGVLRGIQFIYTEPGINRPLKPEDDENKNLSRTKYRNQINKTALAMNEIILGLTNESERQKPHKRIIAKGFRNMEPLIGNEQQTAKTEFATKSKKRLISTNALVFFMTVIILIASIVGYKKVFKSNPLEKLRSSGERISVAVMPFQNMTNDTILNLWGVVIQYKLIDYFSNASQELTVRWAASINDLIRRGRGSSNNYSSLTPTIAGNVSRKLEANIYIWGSINKAGSILKLSAQLIDTKSEEVFKSFQVEGLADEAETMKIIDSLSLRIRNYLIISKLQKQLTSEFQRLVQFGSTNSPEAYKLYCSAINFFLKRDYAVATEHLIKALDIDSNFYAVANNLCFAYLYADQIQKAKKLSRSLFGRIEHMPEQAQLMTRWIYAYFFENHATIPKYIENLIATDDQVPNFYYNLGDAYLELYEYKKAIPAFEKALDIYNRWEVRPIWIFMYSELGTCYHKTGQYRKEEELYDKSDRDFPEDPVIDRQRAILSLSRKDTISANNYIKKYISDNRGNLFSEAELATVVANIYSEAGLPDHAEPYFRKALKSEPQNPLRMHSLANFLIKYDRDISEGLSLENKALEIKPSDYSFMECKGWGLYKNKKYTEALGILQKSWDLRMQEAIYDHEAWIHLAEAKKNVAGMKSN